jgi:hypothetical protein
MGKVCARWLPKRWQQDLAQKVHSTKQMRTPFSEFIDTLCHDNLLLKGSQYHLSPPQLHTQIESNISPELASVFDRWKDNHESSDNKSDKENEASKGPEDGAAAALSKTIATALKAETRLQSFIDTLTKLDQKLIEDHNTHKRDAEDAARSLKCSSSMVGLSDPSHCPPHARSQPNASASSRNQLASSSSSSSCPPKLTDHERSYLENHNGCKKCRGFYLPDGHPCEFPTGDGYVERTMAFVNEARKRIKLPPLPIPRDEHSSSIAAVNNMPSSSNFMYSAQPAQPTMAPPALPVAAVLGMSAYPIVSVCPPNDLSILGGGDSDLSRDSNDSVSTRIPFCLPHLVWECTIDSHDPSSISRIPIEALIDHGSSPVLIDQDLVQHLQLPICLLPRPFPVSGAFFNGSNKTPQISLTHWVKLKLHDRSNWYSARTVRVLVAPSLCHPIILGLPFLYHNNITVNVCDGSAIDMTLNFNLLHPVAPPVHKPIVKLRDVISTNIANRKLLLKELKEICIVR